MLFGNSSIQLRDVANDVIMSDPEWSSKKSNSDFFLVEPEQGNIGIDQIVEVRAFFSHRPAYGQRKYLLVNESEQMTVEAANAFLKMLEEPPSYLVIILTCTSVERHLPTVRSRVVSFSVSYPTDLVKSLKKLYRRESRHVLAVSAEDYIVLRRLLNNPESVKGILAYLDTMEQMDTDALVHRVFDSGTEDAVESTLVRRKAIAWLLKDLSEGGTPSFSVLETLDTRMKKSGKYFDHLRLFASVVRSILRDLSLLNSTTRWSELLNTDLIEWLAGRRPLSSIDADLLWCDRLASMNRAVLNNRLVLHRVVNSLAKHMRKTENRG